MLSIFAGFFLFASAITVNKFILFSLSPIFFVGIRTLSAGLLTAAYLILWRRKFPFSSLWQDLPQFLLISVFTNFVPSILKAYGLKNLSSSKSTLIGSLDPFVTAIFAYFMWNEAFTKNKILGMIIGFSGVLVLLFTTSPAEELAGTWWVISLPELAAIMSMVLARYGWIKGQWLLKSDRYTPLQFNSTLMLIGGTYALLTSLFTGTCDFCTIPPTKNFLFIFAYTVLIGNIAGYTVYAYFLKKYPVTLISLCGISTPLFVHLLGPIVLGEPLSLTFFVALGLVFAGTWIFLRDHRRIPTPKPAT